MGETAQLTTRDLRLLAFVAEHRLVLAAHVQALLATSAVAVDARLRALARAGYLSKQIVFHRQPPCYQITRAGLGAIESRFSKPRFAPDSYAHDVGVAWLWLAARAGVWGPMREVISERRMRSADASPRGAGAPRDPLGVRLGGAGPAGKPRLHYPDLLLVAPAGQRIALELELTLKSRGRREQILAGYAADGRIDAVVYLVEHRSTGRSVEAAARRFGIEHLVQVQEVRWGTTGKPGAGAARGVEPPRRRGDRDRGRSPASDHDRDRSRLQALRGAPAR